MNKNIEIFISTLNTKNTIKVVKSILSDLDEDISNYTIIQLEDFILSKQPNSPKAIITICYVLSLYAKWLKEQDLVEDNSLYQKIQTIDKNSLWIKAKPVARKKFISYSQFKNIVDDIDKYEEFNSLYYQTLFRCVYEGIYSDDMSVISNLRSSDIKENIVMLHEDNGHSFNMEISEELAMNLKELSINDIWERRNRNGICKIRINGKYQDSCFKIENRKNDIDNATYRFGYYAKLRKISKEYLEYNILPFQLYVSGIMHRIKTELERNGIALEDAFSEENRNRTVASIIANELQRCNYNIKVNSFREIVRGNIDMFLD